MNLLKLSWKNIRHKPLPTLLSVILFALGVGMITFLLLLSKQLQSKFDKNLAGIDLVVGAKGSPLQLILCSMYHVDVPTGNVSVGEAKALFSAEHPLIKTAIPLSLGDSHKGYRIVGTIPELVELYGGEMSSGKMFEGVFEVIVGDAVAEDLEIKMGDEFQSAHGFNDDEDLLHGGVPPFRVVGILKPSGSVLDQLILTRTESIWEVHGHVPDVVNDSMHVDASHEHSLSSDYMSFLEKENEEITSILVQYKTRNYRTLNFQRSVNENTDMLAASPAIEINRLYSMMGIGIEALRTIAIVIIVVSAFSIFISLFNSMQDRKYELAVMRTLGAGRMKIFSLIILEGLLLAAIGLVLGLFFSHGGMELFSGYLKEAYRYSFTGKMFLKTEYLLIIGALMLGFLAAFVPAVQASKTEISKTLQSG